MRIALAGAHGTGKTTLAKLLAEKFNLPLISEQAREVARMPRFENVKLEQLLVDRELALEWQEAVFYRQYEIENLHRTTGFVSDRSLWDNLGYWSLYGIDDTEAYRKNVEFARSWRMYDYIFLLSPVWLPTEDGFRMTCPGCQRFVARAIRDLLWEYTAFDDVDTECRVHGLEVNTENRFLIIKNRIRWEGIKKYVS